MHELQNAFSRYIFLVNLKMTEKKIFEMIEIEDFFFLVSSDQRCNIIMRASEVRTDNYTANYRIRTGLFLLQCLHMHA